jgi:hypothetical protein
MNFQGPRAILLAAAGLQLVSTLLFASDAKTSVCNSIPHPRVLVTESRLEFLRKDLKTNSTRRAIFKKDIKANADRWLKRSITIPEQGGWGHDFCGSDGALLELPACQEFDPDVPSRSPTTGKRYDSDKIRAARRYFEHTWRTFAVRDLALVHSIEHRGEYADKAAEILVKYADAYPHFIAEKKGLAFNKCRWPRPSHSFPWPKVMI